MPSQNLFSAMSSSSRRPFCSGRVLSLIVAASLAACDSSEPSESKLLDSTATAEGSTELASEATATAPEAADSVVSASASATAEAVMLSLYVGGRLELAGRPVRGAELVCGVTWEGMDPARLKWRDLRTGDEGNFVIELPGNLRRLDRELELVLRPIKPARSPFKFTSIDLPFPLPQGPVNLGALTIERRDMPQSAGQSLDR